MKVVVIGTGNAATVLGRLIVKCGHEIMQVYGRDKSITDKLALELGSSSINSFSEITTLADLYIVSVTDKAVNEVSEKLSKLPRISGVIVHTSGSVPKEIFLNLSTNFGVLYPLQTLRKETVEIPKVPLLIDGSNRYTGDFLALFAKSLSDTVITANDEERLKVHIAAVFCSNFTNYLYTLAQSFCSNENIAFDILLPLIEETARRLKISSPAQMQTGPAIRKDLTTIKKHLKSLENYPEQKEIYTKITEGILKMNSDA
jgi:predicted short-subunit dehydrogenase-like oxidoreductase (DUF2520 family)